MARDKLPEEKRKTIGLSKKSRKEKKRANSPSTEGKIFNSKRIYSTFKTKPD